MLKQAQAGTTVPHNYHPHQVNIFPMTPKHLNRNRVVWKFQRWPLCGFTLANFALGNEKSYQSSDTRQSCIINSISEISNQVLCTKATRKSWATRCAKAEYYGSIFFAWGLLTCIETPTHWNFHFYSEAVSRKVVATFYITVTFLCRIRFVAKSQPPFEGAVAFNII